MIDPDRYWRLVERLKQRGLSSNLLEHAGPGVGMAYAVALARLTPDEIRAVNVKAEATEPADVAIMPGACLDDPDQLAAMRTQTHDGLIASVGQRRRSGVSWRWWTGADAARMFDVLYPAGGSGDLAPAAYVAYRDQFHAFFAEHGDAAALVVASCKAVRR